MENPFEILHKKIDDIEALLDKMLKPALPATGQKVLMTRKETMEFLGIKDTSLWRLTRDGALKSYKIGNRVMYKREEILSALEEMKQ